MERRETIRENPTGGAECIPQWIHIIAARTKKGEQYKPSSLRGISSSVDRYLTRREYGKRLFIDPEFTTLKAKHAERTEKKKKAEEISWMQLLLSQKRKLIFPLTERSWEQVLHNRYWTLRDWITFYTSVSEVCQNNETYVGVILFRRLTFKAKTILLFFQTDKLSTDRTKTHGMLGMWKRECIEKTKRNTVNVYKL